MLTMNDFTVKDSFEMVDAIKSIPKSLMNEGYVFASFDVIFLFTNVPLKETVNIILKRVYEQNLIATTLNRNTIKKLLLDVCRNIVPT